MRKDLRNTDGNKLPKGKLISQGGHAFTELYKIAQKQSPGILADWENEHKTKITLEVDSEAELLEIYGNALIEGLTVTIVEDLGFTEIQSGTYTCIGIGPDYSEKIDKITKHLRSFR